MTGATRMMMLARQDRTGYHKKSEEYMNPSDRYDVPEGNYGGYGARSNYTRNEYGDVEARFRDRRGREHYDSGRFAPMRGSMDGEESGGSAHWNDYPPPVYGGDDKRMSRMIGFERNSEIGHDYRSDAAYSHGDDLEHRRSSMEHGGARGSIHKLDKKMAEDWMDGIENADGTRGAHWSLDQVKQVIAQRKWDIDPIEAWVAMNAVYSDYCNVAKSHNANNVDFYVAMAKAFADDADAKPEKLALYYQYIVK